MIAAVETRGVNLRFGDLRVLRDLSVTVPEGAFVAVIGPNGAGKTTFLNVVMGLQRPDSGAVSLFGQPPEVFPSEQIGYVPQVKTLDRRFPAEAIELVVSGLRRAWPWRTSDEEQGRALEAMKQAGVERLARRALSTLSGGELQRVYLARSLARRPRLLILDEPAAGMDLAGEAAMYHILKDYQEEQTATVLMITHDWEGARYHASHVLLMTPGEVVFGAPASIGSEERLLRAFGFAGHAEETHG